LHAAVLTLSDVNGRFADSVLPGQIHHLLPRFVLLQNLDNLLFIEPAFFIACSPLSSLAGAENLNYGWSKLSRAGQHSSIRTGGTHPTPRKHGMQQPAAVPAKGEEWLSIIHARNLCPVIKAASVIPVHPYAPE